MNLVINIVLLVIVVTSSVYMLRKKVNLGLIMLWDSVFLVGFAHMPISHAANLALKGAVSEKTTMLILILLLIMVIENIMRTTGMINNMVGSLKELVGDNRIAAALMPAVIGFLPSPGGARFSCPMVEEISGNTTDAANKAFINYWFRHICLDGFILYPGSILAAELLGVPVISFFLHLTPFIVISALVGTFFGLTKMKKEVVQKTKSVKENLKIFSIAMLPVTTLILLYILLLKITSYSLEISAGVIVIALFIARKYNPKRIWSTIREAFPLKLVIIIVGVMVFKEILMGTGVMEELTGWMDKHGIPVEILFILLPFIAGATSGITVSMISITFPVLIPLGMDKSLWYGVIAFAAGTIGGMVTPLHLCAVMTADYFKTSVSKLLTKIFLAETIILAVLIIVLIAMSSYK